MKMNEHVLITGASSKLGKLISKILAKKNYSLLLHYYKSEKKTINLAIISLKYFDIIKNNMT